MKTTIRRVLLIICVLITTLMLWVTLEHVCAEFRPYHEGAAYENLVLDQIATGYMCANLDY